MRILQNYIMINLVSEIESKLKAVENYQQVNDLIKNAIAKITNADQVAAFTEDLYNRIDRISPMDCSSTQWSCYRYSLVVLRQFSKSREQGRLAGV